MAAMLTDAAIGHLKKIDKNRKEQDKQAERINLFHSKLNETAPERAENFKDTLWNKLKVMYERAKELAEQEEDECGMCIKELESSWGLGSSMHRKKHSEWSDQKRKRIKSESAMDYGAGSSFASGRIASPAGERHIGEISGVFVGDQVAARVTPDDAPKDDWIVVKVTRFDRDSSRYEVIDEEPGDDEEPTTRKYRLASSSIIPFPRQTDPSTAPDFPPAAVVLAVFPGTTSLYRATVMGAPRKRKADNYILAFDDDVEEGVEGLPQRSVPFFHVVPLPPGHRQ